MLIHRAVIHRAVIHRVVGTCSWDKGGGWLGSLVSMLTRLGQEGDYILQGQIRWIYIAGPGEGKGWSFNYL